MIPECFEAYRSSTLLLDDVTEWSLLRKWSLSEVYRASLPSGETRIIKWGGKEMAGEAAIYERLVGPLNIPSPIIYGYYERDDSAVMMMEDCGTYNLEQQPQPELFLEAAKGLARLRDTATTNLESLSEETLRFYTVPASHFLALLDDLLRSPRLSGNAVLIRLQSTLPTELNKLYEAVPLTLVHHDYHAKNLLIQDGRILPIDWSIAYLSPHLGDLYCLMNEAHFLSGISKEDILAAFQEESQAGLTIEQFKWQLRIGGICWLVKTLRWLVYGGTDTIPGSEAWIPGLINDLEGLCQ